MGFSSKWYPSSCVIVLFSCFPSFLVFGISISSLSRQVICRHYCCRRTSCWLSMLLRYLRATSHYRIWLRLLRVFEVAFLKKSEAACFGKYVDFFSCNKGSQSSSALMMTTRSPLTIFSTRTRMRSSRWSIHGEGSSIGFSLIFWGGSAKKIVRVLLYVMIAQPRIYVVVEQGIYGI